MALIEKDAIDHTFDCLIDRRVFEDDVGGFATEFEREFFAGAGERVLDYFPHIGRAGECDLCRERVIDHQRACFGSAGDDVDHAGWESGILQDRCKLQRGDRCRFGGLDHHRVSGGEGWRDFPCQHQERKIPWDHLADDAEWREPATGGDMIEFVGPAGVIEKVRGRHRQVEVA